MRWLGLKAERVTCMVRVRVLGWGRWGKGWRRWRRGWMRRRWHLGGWNGKYSPQGESKTHICIFTLSYQPICWKWNFDASKSMKIAWRLSFCVWGLVIGTLEFVKSTLNQIHNWINLSFTRKVFFKAKWKITFWFLVLIDCFSLSLFEGFLNCFDLGWLNCKPIQLVDSTIQPIDFLISQQLFINLLNLFSVDFKLF